MGMIYLERHNPTQRMHRYYCLMVEQNLFGEWSLIREWGRVGRSSQTKIEWHATEQAALAAMHRRAAQKRRREYAEFVTVGRRGR